MWRAGPALVVLAVVAGAAGCGSGRDPVDAVGPPSLVKSVPPTQPVTTAPPSTEPPAASPAASPVAEVAWPTVFNSWTGGGELPTDCDYNWETEVPSEPSVGTGSGDLLIGDDTQICLTGFDPAAPITLTVERPDGSVRSAVVQVTEEATLAPEDLLGPELPAEIGLAEEGGYLATRYGQLRPMMLAGDYTLTAEQGEVRAGTRLRLYRGALGDREAARILPADSYERAHGITSGETVEILLLDFPPSRTVPMALFRNTGTLRRHGENGQEGDGYDFAFLGHLPPVETNEQGWAYYRMVVPGTLPEPENESDPDFCVVADPNLTEPYCQPGFAGTFSLRK